MPTYSYKAVNTKGEVFKNKVESGSKRILVKMLKDNNYTPIEVVQVAKSISAKSKKRRNISQLQELMSNVNSTSIAREQNDLTFKERISKYMIGANRISKRDLVVFTENFYLLKKANFNNIHALSTIIKSTENPLFKGILEDILVGVESGENMYTTMEYYDNVFPYLYTNMIRVGELSRVAYNIA